MMEFIVSTGFQSSLQMHSRPGLSAGHVTPLPGSAQVT